MLAPQDLRTSDPTVAGDIYAGLFVFAGRAVSTGGRSPFDVLPPSRGWADALYGFGWLRHLREAGTALARSNARALTDDFLSRRWARGHRALQTPALARRTIAFLTHSPFLLDGADFAFYQRFLRAIGRSVRRLEGDLHHAPQPLDRLRAAIALSYASLCCEGLEPLIRKTTRALSHELDGQILPDGGHVSRSPRILVDLLLDLLPLRQTFASRGLEAPESLVRAIDRMLPHLRLLRHGDGTLGHFNGAGPIPPGRVATLLMYDSVRGKAMRRAPHSGYERLEAGDTVVIVDAGGAPPPEAAAEAHAGCLSFEMSSGSARLVINCGAPRNAEGEARLAARSTAAHSTATIAATSSGRFLLRQGWWLERALASWLIRRLDQALIQGPRQVPSERDDRSGESVFTARHDGYRRRFGLDHERRLKLAADGTRLEGEDRVLKTDAPLGSDDVVLRFHLDPGVKASRPHDRGAVLLTLPNREEWRFAADEVEPGLEESVFFAASGGFRRTTQIVLAFQARSTPAVHWRFERITPMPERSRRQPQDRGSSSLL